MLYRRIHKELVYVFMAIPRRRQFPYKSLRFPNRGGANEEALPSLKRRNLVADVRFLTPLAPLQREHWRRAGARDPMACRWLGEVRAPRMDQAESVITR